MIIKSFLFSSGLPLSFPDCDVFLTNRGVFVEYPIVTDLGEDFYYWKQGCSMRVSVVPRFSSSFSFSFNKFMRFYFKIDDFSSLGLSSGSIDILNIGCVYVGSSTINTSFGFYISLQSSSTFKYCFTSRASKSSTLYTISSESRNISELYSFSLFDFSFDAGGNFIFKRNNDIISLSANSFFSGYCGFNGSIITTAQDSLNPPADFYFIYFGCVNPFISNSYNLYFSDFQFGDAYSLSKFASQDDKISSLHSFIESNCKINLDGSIDYTKAFKFLGSDGREFYLTEELMKYCNQFK